MDRHLLPSQLADLRAFQALVEDSLDDIHMYHLWMEQKNVETVTQSLYATRLPFPANWWVPKMMKRNIQTRLATRLPADPDKVYAKAEEIYTALSRKLGTNDYFFGTSFVFPSHFQLPLHIFAHFHPVSTDLQHLTHWLLDI